MENKLIENWRNLIVEAENQLKKFESTSDFSDEDKSIYETWEHFLYNQKSSLENYINFLNHKLKVE